ncbi:hypothetical protein RclHR1_15210004 [Rhizophagus clarus]|uniref:Tc1-like transposase DDE domain-containing protein n=1 Tax=Rhizophagus clarus TaxID=94130 RepID=A0A2Z6QEM8_9GLOM|nr:hypothetical protein RclHR1_15210004 [Rhizophagus clarus]
MMTGIAQFLPMKHPSGCLATLCNIDIEVKDQFIAFQKTEQELMHGVDFVFGEKLVFIGMTGVEIIRDHLSEIRRMLRNNWLLQQDNDPKHTSRVAKEFLQENVPTVMDWLSIKNLWAVLKRNVEMRQPKILGN